MAGFKKDKRQGAPPTKRNLTLPYDVRNQIGFDHDSTEIDHAERSRNGSQAPNRPQPRSPKSFHTRLGDA